jgi:hypothetical protein
MEQHELEYESHVGPVSPLVKPDGVCISRNCKSETVPMGVIGRFPMQLIFLLWAPWVIFRPMDHGERMLCKEYNDEQPR